MARQNNENKRERWLKVRQVGVTLVLTIPKEVAEKLKMKKGDYVSIDESQCGFTVTRESGV